MDNHWYSQTKRTLLLLLLSGLVLLASGCGTRIRIPRPGDPVLPAPPFPTLEDSVVDIPIEFPLQTAVDAAEQKVPVEQGEETDWQNGGPIVGHVNFQYKYRFWRRPFQVSGAGNTLSLNLAATYRIRGRIHPSPINIEGSCGYDADPVKRINLGLSSDLMWTEAYQISSKTDVRPVEFLDPCRVTALNIDATPVMKFLLQPKLESAAAAFDERLPVISDFRSKANLVWTQLQQPLAVPPDLWLMINPTSVQAGPMNFSDGIMRTSAGLVARPRLTAGPKPTPGQNPLPNLGTLNSSPGVLHIPFEVEFPFADASKAVAQQLVGTELVIIGKKKIKITSVQIYGSGGSAIIAVGIKGSVKGTVYFTGRPTFDNSAQVLRFESVDFTLESRNILANLASWLLHDRFVTLIQERSTVNISSDIARAKQLLTAMLNRDLTSQLQLSGSISELRPVGVFVGDKAIRAQVIVDGTAKITIK